MGMKAVPQHPTTPVPSWLMFIDEIKIFARAGHGGKGRVAFLRETFRPKGGPSGGNGGRGGDVILQADHDLNNLIGQYYQPRLIAEEGEDGMGKGMDGRAGKNRLVKVPCGTLVWRRSTVSEPIEQKEEPNEEIKSFALSSRQRPVIRHAARARSMEIDLAAEPEEYAGSRGPSPKGELI